MYHESTGSIAILFYTNKHDKFKNDCVILENMSLLYSAQEFEKSYTRYSAKISKSIKVPAM